MIVLRVTGHMGYGRQYIMLGRQRPQEGSHSMDFDQQMICTVILNLVSGQENLSIQCQSLPSCFSPVCHVFCLTNLHISLPVNMLLSVYDPYLAKQHHNFALSYINLLGDHISLLADVFLCLQSISGQSMP